MLEAVHLLLTKVLLFAELRRSEGHSSTETTPWGPGVPCGEYSGRLRLAETV